MDYIPETPEQIEEAKANNAFQPWPAGEYQFSVLSATEGAGAKGPYIKLNLTVYNNQGHSRGVFDYLPSSYPPKIRQFCECVGLVYGTGKLLPHEMEGKSGRVTLKIETQPGYEPQNKVGYYRSRPKTLEEVGQVAVKQSAHSKAKANAYVADTTDLNDEIPF